ncbi:MAG: tetratricopeptide repeat protein [Planctomycetota bacterium]|jgi:tetratricopeptide (TPR) repeat protein
MKITPLFESFNTVRTVALLIVALGATGCARVQVGTDATFRRDAVAVLDHQAAELTELGATLVEEGNLENALRAFERALERDPNHVDAHVGVGDVYHQRGDFNVAADSYRQARDLNPSHYPANYKLGLMYHLLNRLQEAIESYLAALKLNPNSFEANFNLATAYLQTGQTTVALPYAERAVNLGAREAEPETLQAAFANLGAIYSSLGRHDDAVRSYLSAADQGELPPPIAGNLVNALIKTEEMQRALDTLSVLLVIEQKPEYYERLGYVNFKLGAYDDSLAAYDNALGMNPENTAALNGIGVNMMTRYLQNERRNPDERDQAVRAWQQSIQIDGDQPKILNLITRYSKL